MKILLTGSAGFIGYHTAKALLDRGDRVIGFDNFNTYYDATLKEARNDLLVRYPQYEIIRGDLKDNDALSAAFEALGVGSDTRVCHLAAQAGVRHSIEHPDMFITDNINGFHNVIQLVKDRGVGGLIYASSSSVYGGSEKTDPLTEDENTDHQKSLYGMTKKENELHARVYHDMFGIHTTGLRFFTVYGPYGRPDMALFIFTKAVLEGAPLPVFGYGKMQRDFTYVDDIVAGVLAAMDRNYPCEIFNLGAGKTEELMDYIHAVEQACGCSGKKEYLPMQIGDVVRTVGDISKAKQLLGFQPRTLIKDGVPKFVDWYRSYYSI